MTVIHVGGRFVTDEEAKVSLLDRGYLLGEGVFATMRGYHGACFRPMTHLNELVRGAALFDIPVEESLDALAALADEAARRTSASSAYVRVTLTRGPDQGTPTLSILARPMILPSEDDYARGVGVVTVTPRRIPRECIDGTIKTTSYAVQSLARREATKRGAAEGIQLAVDGSLACAAMANLFVVLGDQLLTPGLASGCRAGVTRAALLELAKTIGLLPIEARLDPSILGEADEVFLTSTRVECLPIATIDGRDLGARSGFPRTHALRAAFLRLVDEETRTRRTGGRT